jgi:hypothetical protein
MAKKIQLRFIEDPSHGWAEVPETLCKALGLTEWSAQCNGMMYFEEDCEVADLEEALKKHQYRHTFVSCYVDSFDRWLESTEWPDIPSGPDEIDGEAGALGDLVFWYDRKPRWIVEWQPDNGRVFAIIDAEGNVGVAGASELSRDFRVGHEREHTQEAGE